jgi:hypothetical protein
MILSPYAPVGRAVPRITIGAIGANFRSLKPTRRDVTRFVISHDQIAHTVNAIGLSEAVHHLDIDRGEQRCCISVLLGVSFPRKFVFQEVGYNLD